jgi:Holliday junction DNA helicase RuvA
MIKGTATNVMPSGLDVAIENVGMALHVIVAEGHSFVVGAHVEIVTHVVWNQENGPSLYGFTTLAHKDAFCLLLGCPGIGPKVALAILSELSIEQLIEAIVQREAKQLSKVSGIGPKKAEQILLYLQGKVEKLRQIPGVVVTGSVAHFSKAQEVLESLGYSRQEILLSMNYVRDQIKSKESTFDEVVRQCLAFLAKRL